MSQRPYPLTRADATAARSLRQVFEVLGCVIQLAFNSYWSLVGLLPLCGLYYAVARYYRHSSRELKRISSVATSPIYSAFEEALAGEAHIRAFDAAARFARENRRRFNRSMKAQFVSQASQRWLAVRLDAMGQLVVGLSAALAVSSYLARMPPPHGGAMAPPSALDDADEWLGGAPPGGGGSYAAGLAGMALQAALMMTETLSWLLRFFTELETQMVSVERLLQYTKLPPEEDAHASAALKQRGAHAPNAPPATTGAARHAAGSSPTQPPSDGWPAADWPSSGEIIFHDVQMRYRAGLPLVLHGLTLTISDGEHVGICGRTGAGKTSVLACLFRTVSLERGSVMLGGVDTSRVPRRSLRLALATIPQDSILFSGSLRYNLDPFGERQDDELLATLERCAAARLVSEHADGLHRELDERGSNLSSTPTNARHQRTPSNPSSRGALPGMMGLPSTPRVCVPCVCRSGPACARVPRARAAQAREGVRARRGHRVRRQGRRRPRAGDATRHARSGDRTHDRASPRHDRERTPHRRDGAGARRREWPARGPQGQAGGALCCHVAKGAGGRGHRCVRCVRCGAFWPRLWLVVQW